MERLELVFQGIDSERREVFTDKNNNYYKRNYEELELYTANGYDGDPESLFDTTGIRVVVTDRKFY